MMTFREFLETQINKYVQGDMQTWGTNDLMGQLDFKIIKPDTLYVHFLRNRDEYSDEIGAVGNLLAILKELRAFIANHPEIKKVVADVRNDDVGQWLLKKGATITQQGGTELQGMFELPARSV